MYFEIMLLWLLLDCDLYQVLLELSGVEDPDINEPAQKYLKQLTLIVYNILPDHSNTSHFLISAANVNENLLMGLKSRSSRIVQNMGNYMF